MDSKVEVNAGKIVDEKHGANCGTTKVDSTIDAEK